MSETTSSLATTLPTSAGAVVADMQRTINTPIVGTVDFAHLFLLTGLVILSVIAWNLILFHIRAAGAAVGRTL